MYYEITKERARRKKSSLNIIDKQSTIHKLKKKTTKYYSNNKKIIIIWSWSSYGASSDAVCVCLFVDVVAWSAIVFVALSPSRARVVKKMIAYIGEQASIGNVYAILICILFTISMLVGRFRRKNWLSAACDAIKMHYVWFSKFLYAKKKMKQKQTAAAAATTANRTIRALFSWNVHGMRPAKIYAKERVREAKKEILFKFTIMLNFTFAFMQNRSRARARAIRIYWTEYQPNNVTRYEEWKQQKKKDEKRHRNSISLLWL